MSRDKHLRVAPKTLANARQLRRPLTPAEKKLWWKLSAGQLGGFKFRRQHPIGPYIADFCCMERRLVVELDGDTHVGQEGYDASRTGCLNAQGYRVLRFTNADVHERLSLVLEAILSACEEKTQARLSRRRDAHRRHAFHPHPTLSLRER